MALRIGELVGLIRADDSGMRRGISDAELRMRGLQRDMDGRLRDLRGRFTSESRLLGRALGDGVGRGGDRARLSLGRIAGMARGLGGVAAAVGGIAAKLGAAVPVAAGLAATLVNIAPAAGVAATSVLAAVSATAALKIGMAGVGDAVKEAFTGDDPKKLAEAMKKLSPEARNFVQALQGLKPQLDTLKEAVQDKLFNNLDSVLKSTAKSTLPLLRKNLVSSAGALNEMAKGVLGAGRELATSGTLGRALGSATAGLHNLANVPGIVVTSLGQIAAAAGPSFQRLTNSVSDAAVEIGNRLGDAFASGRMQDAIETAIGLIGDLIDVAGNVGRIIGSVFSAAQVSGGGFIGTLQQITGALADAFASPAVQDGLKALFSTMSTLAQTAAPLLGQALGLIAPVLAELGPPVQTLIKALGDALSPIIDALGPVLKAAAQAVGVLVEAIAPLLPVVGDLVAALLPALTPLLDAVSEVFGALAPVVEEVAGILQDALSPILAALPGIIAPLAQIIADRLIFFIQFLGDLLKELGPSLVTLGQTFGELMVALSPLIQALADLTSQLLTALMPILQPLIGLIATLAQLFATGLATIISTVVVPVIQFLAKLLSGDFSGAWDMAKQAVQKAKDWIAQAAAKIGPIIAEAVAAAIRWLNGMPSRAYSALSTLAGNLRSRAADAGAQMVSAVRQKLSDAVAWVKGLPGRARSALGNLNGVLAAAGRSLISGFIDGIKSKFSSVKSTLGNLTSNLTSWKGPEDVDKRILTPAGRMVIAGFQRGIAAQVPALRAQLHGLTGEVPGMALGGMSGSPAAAGGGTTAVRIVLDGPEAMTRLIRGIVQDKGGGNVQLAFGR